MESWGTVTKGTKLKCRSGLGDYMSLYLVLGLGDKWDWYFLAVQNSSLGDLVTHSLTHSLTVLLLLRHKEQSQRLVTFETFD